MKVAIIGGGVNGLSCAWELATAGNSVTLYERDKLVSHTSRYSSKLLHGGLRYLEHYQFRLVREALIERDAWLKRVPSLAKPIRLIIPVYSYSKRGRIILGAGMLLYDKLLARSDLPGARWLSASEIASRDPGFCTKDLKGGYEFSDGQADDYRLGLWIADRAKEAGAVLIEQKEVVSVTEKGEVQFADSAEQFDCVINVAGPWVEQLLERSQVKSPYKLDIVRGSHLVLKRPCHQACLLEVPKEKRVFFVLPWKGETLIGTTEVRQKLGDPIKCSTDEREYLLSAYRTYRTDCPEDLGSLVSEEFAGVRPLLYSADNPTRASREYAITKSDRLVNVFGGKWTTSLALARQVRKTINGE